MADALGGLRRRIFPLQARRDGVLEAAPLRPLPARSAAKAQYLTETDVFQGLSAQDMDELNRMTTMTSCPRGRVFYTPGATGEVLFVLKKGRVNVYRIAPDGRKLVTSTLGPGTVFGEMWFFGQGLRGSFAEAAEDCTLCVMSRGDVERLLAEHPALALRMLDLMSTRLAEAEERLEMLAFRSVPSRLAATLLRLAGENGHEVAGVSQQDLAEMVGAYRETTTRVLNEFQDRGLIELHRRRIQILDRAGLAALAEE